MNKKIVSLLLFVAILALPTIAFADPPQLTLAGVDVALTTIKNFVFAIFLSIAVIMFIIAGYYFLVNDPSKGRQAVIWGVVGVGVGILSYSIAGIVACLITGGGGGC